MQEIDPGSAKILQKPAKDDIYKCCGHINIAQQQDTGKLERNINIICLQTPTWKVSFHQSII